MGFQEKLPEWKAVGIEPPTSLKETGYKANDEPAPDHWNYIHNRGYLALKELQENAVHEEDYTVVTDPDTGLLARLNTEKSNDVIFGIGTNTIKATKASLFNLTNIAGRMLLNLLGRDGNFESLAGWTFTGASGALDTSNKVYGSNATKVTLSANTGTVSKSIPVTAGKKYLLAADIKNGTANAKVYATGVTGTLVTSTTSFQTSYLLFTASSTTNLAIGISVSGASGQVVYADGIRLYELSDADYNAANKMNTTGIVARYPYTEGLAGVKNPYAIRWLDDNKTDIGALLAFDTELLSSPTGGDTDTLIKGSDGHYYKSTLWRKLQLDGGQAWASSSDGNRNGYKKVYMTIVGIADPVYTIKYNGDLISRATGDVSDYGANKIYVNTTNGVVEYSIATADSGWGDSYTPTVNEIKAYFYGWKMYDMSTSTDGSSIYNRTDGANKAWARRTNGINSDNGYADGTLIVPTVKAIGFKAYELMYKRTSLVVEPISSEGKLDLIQGDNIIEIGSGLVLRESATPQKVGAYYWMNGTTNPPSILANRVQKFIQIYKNSRFDRWNYLGTGEFSAQIGLQQAQIPITDYDPNAVYTATYIVTSKYPVVSFTGICAQSELALLNNLSGEIQQITRRVSVVENKKLDANNSRVWITPTMLNGWVNIPNRPPLAYSIEGNTVYIRGEIRSGTIGAVVFVLPPSMRPQANTTEYIVYSYGSSGIVGASIVLFSDGRVAVQNGNTEQISLGNIQFSI